MSSDHEIVLHVRRTCESDIAGPAPLNDDSMEVDVDILLLAKRYDKFMLFDLIKHPNMQLASKYRKDVLGIFVYLLLLVFVSGKKFEISRLFVQLNNMT